MAHLSAEEEGTEELGLKVTPLFQLHELPREKREFAPVNSLLRVFMTVGKQNQEAVQAGATRRIGCAKGREADYPRGPALCWPL